MLLSSAWIGAVLGALRPGAALLAALAVVAVAAMALCRRHPGRSLLAACLAVAAIASAGAAVRTQAIVDGPLANLTDSPVAVEVSLTIVADVRQPTRGSRWVLARLATVGVVGRARFPSRERVVLQLPADAAVEFGGGYTLRGVATPITGPTAQYFRGRGAVVRVDAIELQAARDPPAWQRATTTLRARTAAAAHRWLSQAQGSLLTGLVTGDLQGQPDQVAEEVNAAGLSHLVAVSGSNVAIVIAGAMALSLMVGFSRRTGWWLSAGAVWWFVVLVRGEPSVVRAATMATLVLAAMLIGRVRSTVHLLSTAGMLVLLTDPLLATRIGFVLSMAATAGVILLTPVIAQALDRRTRLPRLITTVLAATCGAQLAVAPVLLLSGGTVHPASVPANLIAVPAAGVASLIGGVAAVVSLVDVGVAGGVAASALPALSVVLATAHWFASDSGRHGVEVALMIGLVVALASRTRGWPLGARVGVAGVGLCVVIALRGPVGLPGSGLPETPVLVVLDVGQGDALLLGDPQAGWILIDGGPDPDTVVRELARRRIDRLAAVVVSHPHADHTVGLIAVLGRVQVGLVVLGPHGEVATDVVSAAQAAGAPISMVAAGDRWAHGRMAFRVLSPPAVGLGPEPNENSLVLRVDVDGGRSALLPGDAEVLAQTLIIDDPALDVDVVKVPHHGGATNFTGFLAATTPQLAVISVGVDNPFGHPNPAVLADLGGIDVRRTDVDGEVVVSLGGP